MGKWDRRWIPRRRYNNKKYRDYDYEEPPPSPPSPHHPQSNPPPIQENSGSSWEIDFCKSVGVPWKKVLAAKNYMYCYDYVAKWDDSTGEEAFNDAKKRYWEKINCLPYETPLPDKDMYVDKINWNPDIDPELISDLDREYFNPDEVGKGNLWTRVKMENNAVPVCALVQNNENPDGELAWESDRAQRVGTLNETLPHWGHGNKSINSKDVNNPWEQSHTLVDKLLKNNAWKGSADESSAQGVRTCWGQNAKSIGSKDAKNPWEESRTQFDESLKNNAQKGSASESPAQGVRTHCEQNAKPINSKDVINPWEQSHSHFDESLKNSTWKGSPGESTAQGARTHWGQNANSISSKDVNPWEQSCTPVGESSRNNAWKGCTEESRGWRKESTYNRWSKDDNKNAGDKGWTHVDDRSRGQKQWNINSHEQQNPANTGNTWQRSFASHTGVSLGSRGWTEHGNNSRVWKQPEIQSKHQKHINYNGPFGSGRAAQSGCRKREGSLQHSSRYKTSRFQGDDYMTAQKWR